MDKNREKAIRIFLEGLVDEGRNVKKATHGDLAAWVGANAERAKELLAHMGADS